jgi:8-oxo-dGTP diphosphatase
LLKKRLPIQNMKNINQEKSLQLQKIIDSFSQSIPQLSVDCVILCFHDNELKILLSKFTNLDLWGLQGGYVGQNEDVDVAAKRILAERAHVKDIFLKQFHVFGEADRPTSDSLKELFKDTAYNIDELPVFKQRFVSIGYYSLVNFLKVTPTIGLFSDQCAWFNISNLPQNMAFDHAAIIKKALETLRNSLDYQRVGFNLMPETFTMNELQKLYETILGQTLSRNNFQRKILDMNILERLEKKFDGGAHKAPYLYRFK